MGLVAKSSGDGSYTLAPEGTHVARCVQMIDLGTQWSEAYQKASHKVLIGWELPNEPNGDGGPVIVFRRYTVSLHEKAAMRSGV
jgi:hypothetical protein